MPDSFVLGSQSSSTYPKGTLPVIARLPPRYLSILSSLRMQSQEKERTLVDLEFASKEEGPVEAGDGDGDELDREQQSANDGFRRGRREDEMHAEKLRRL